MSDGWGPGGCATCGHPAAYHGATFCTVRVGSAPESQRPECDCPGWNRYLGPLGRAVRESQRLAASSPGVVGEGETQ